MKNASKYAEELRRLFRSLLREGRPDPKQRLEPLDALVRGAMSFDVSDSRAADAVRAISKEFVDLNELRVATDLEIQELLGVKYPAIEQRVQMITQSLNSIFEREHTMNLDRFKAVSKRETRAFLRELPGITPFVEAFVMMFSFDGHAIPVDDEILAYLKDQEALDGGAAAEEAQRFLESHLKSEEIDDFYVVVRRAAHADGPRKKAKS